jgi:RHS repeat-associated protein
VPNQLDVLGVANPTADVTVRVVGGTTYTAARKGEYYHHALTVGNNVYPTVEAKSLYGATETRTGRVFNPPSTETFVHDADGNLTSDGRWSYIWDGENRLVEMKRDTSTPSGARLRLTFEYDHQGRRIRRQFYTYTSGWVEQTDFVFLYDGWNVMGELDANASNARLRTYVWGQDLSGTMEGAGGVGGLLKVKDYLGSTTEHFVAYDGNGNVAGSTDAGTGAITARYEYGPFGEAIRATGVMGKKNPMRFSTKYTDDQTGLLYYGYRYYNPTTGRWVSRDPIEEAGGDNLYMWVHNAPDQGVDFLGLTVRSTVDIRLFGGSIELYLSGNRKKLYVNAIEPATGTWAKPGASMARMLFVTGTTMHAVIAGATSLPVLPRRFVGIQLCNSLHGEMKISGCCPSGKTNVTWIIHASVQGTPSIPGGAAAAAFFGENKLSVSDKAAAAQSMSGNETVSLPGSGDVRIRFGLMQKWVEEVRMPSVSSQVSVTAGVKCL